MRTSDRRPNRRRPLAVPDPARWAPPAWFLLLGLVTLGPLLGGGYVLLLDTPAGPHLPWPSFFPLPSEGLVSAVGAPIGSILRLIGSISPQIPSKLLVLAVVAGGGFGLFRFARRELGLSPVAAVAGGTLFAVNPYVFDRVLAGQLLVAAGYAALPWALPAFLRLVRDAAGRRVIVSAAWVAGISLIDLHAGGMALLLFLAAVAVAPGRWPRRLLGAVGGVAAVVAINLYWILPTALTNEASAPGSGDLLAYAPRPASLGILPHELVLHGFWRVEFRTPLSVDPALFLATFVPLLTLVAAGFAVAVRSRAWRKPALALGAAAAVSLMLGMGISFAPTAWLTRFLFAHLPGYGIFREPQKWIGVLALAYGVFAAVGAEWVLRTRPRWRDVTVPLLVLLPIAATRLLFWGLGGTVHPSAFPADWRRADTIMAARPGTMLSLPWNQYEPVSFADDRTVVDLARYAFSVPVLESQDPQLIVHGVTPPADPRTRYVADLIEHREAVTRFGHLVAPLGIRYVGLAHEADFRRYAFLADQVDLRPVLRGRTFTLYENRAWRGSVYPLGRAPTSAGSVGDLLTDDASQRLASSVLQAWPATDTSAGPGVDVSFLPWWERLEPVGAPFMGTDRSCLDGWRLGDHAAVCEVGAVAAFPDPSSPRTLWRPRVAVQGIGSALSILAAAGLVVALRRARRG
ncbi:MAG: hypothetical protein ABR600_07840 [Actinomycetota bacterium]